MGNPAYVIGCQTEYGRISKGLTTRRPSPPLRNTFVHLQSKARELSTECNIRNPFWNLSQLRFQFVVHHEHGEFSPGSFALGFRKLEEFALHIFLQLGDGITGGFTSGRDVKE